MWMQTLHGNYDPYKSGYWDIPQTKRSVTEERPNKETNEGRTYETDERTNERKDENYNAAEYNIMWVSI